MTGLSLIYLARFAEREQNHSHNDDLKSRFDAFGCLIDSPTIEGFDASDFRQTLNRVHERTRNIALAQAQGRVGKPQVDSLRLNCNQLISLRKKLK